MTAKLWEGPSGTLWSCSARGSVVWIREGRSGKQGRTTYEQLADEEAAQARAHELARAKEKAGFRVVSEAFRFDARTLRKAAPARAKSTPEEVARWCHRELTREAKSHTLRTAMMVVWRGPPCSFSTWALAVEANELGLELRREFTRGWRNNPDDGEFETLTVQLVASHALSAGEVLQVSPLDLDKRQEPLASLQSRWLAALEHDADWAPLLESEVTVERLEL